MRRYFVQISDLHIAAMKTWPKLVSPHPGGRKEAGFPSSQGHSVGVAHELALWLRRFRAAYGVDRLLVTGDLTRRGSDAEFGWANRFISSSWRVRPPGKTRIGMELPGDLYLSIPGNHDFWGGRSYLRSMKISKGFLGPFVWPTPWIDVFESCGTEFHFLGLDSCSRLGSISPNQFVAMGAIEGEELASASAMFESAAARAFEKGHQVVRVVLCHHPPSELIGRETLIDWLDKLNVRLVLTGHTHQSFLDGNSGLGACFEIRCGTTLQEGTESTLPGPEPNTFVLHSVVVPQEPGRGVVWEAVRYCFDGGGWENLPEPDPAQGTEVQFREELDPLVGVSCLS